MSGKRLLSLIVMLLASVLFVGTAHAADATWSAEYWNNTTLSGTPAVTRNESVLSYDWGLGSPAASIDPDTFSARWERDVNFNAGTYRFTTVSDDGIRVYVDGDRIINNWTDHAATVNTADVTLTAGDHEIVVEYYENELQAIVGIDWYELPDDIDDWRGEYFDNEFLAGTPDLIRDDETIDFDWGEGSPSSLIDDDFFSVRWTQTLDLSAGTYRFTVTADDGVRLYVDGDLEIDAWVEQPATTYTETVTHNGGDLDVVLEYFEREGFASVELDIDQVDDDDDPPTGTVIRDIDSPSTVIGGPPSDWNERSTGGAQGNYLWSENYYNIVAGAYNWV
ncbi:MAG: PA14 domain-containing protein, partial [Anaerolineae bacterium]